MRKNNMLVVLAIAMAVTVGATACGAKDSTKTTEASQEISTDVSVAETNQDATEETESVNAEETNADESTAEETEEETTEEETESTADVGNVDAGVFTAKSGKFQITLPKDWTVNEDSDESVTTFDSPSGGDYLEVTYVEGDDAEDELENYPATKEEYKELISRGDDMDIIKYDVKNESNGSITFRYAIRYKNPGDGVRYYAVSGSYDAAAKKYIMAAGTVESEGSEVESQIEASLDSFKLK